MISPERHHAAPRCLLRLRDEAEGALRLTGVGAWLEFELEAERWGVPVEIGREDLDAAIAAAERAKLKPEVLAAAAEVVEDDE